ncbi:hypothetical protein MASR2M117_24570 [Paludibacter sp.]
MKIRFILGVVIMTSVMAVSAQKVGFKVGYVSSTEVTDASSVVFPNLVSGFQVGPVAESSLLKNLDIHYGVLYTMLTKNFDGAVGKNNYTGHFVDVPLQAQYSFPLGGALKVFAFAGPDFSFSLGQKTVNTTIVFGNEVKTEFIRHDYDANNDKVKDISRFDVKFGLGAGAQYNNIQLRVGYDWGLLDLNTLDNYHLTKNQLTASVVYQF